MPDASRTPSTSVISTSWRAPNPAASPAAASSALTLHTTPSSSRASGATTGTWSATSSESMRSRRIPTTVATSPTLGRRWPMSRPPSTPESPTASQPTSRSAATSSLFTTPRRTAAATSSAAGSVTRSPPSKCVGTPRRSSHSVIRLPPPWTSTTGRFLRDRGDLREHLPLVRERRPAQLHDDDLAHVVYSLFSRTYSSVRSQPKASPVPVAEAEVEPDQDLRAAHGHPRRRLVDVDRPARRPVVDEVAGDRDPQRRRVEARGRARPVRRLARAEARRLEDRPLRERRVAGGTGDPAPVGVTAVDRGLDQRRRDHRPGRSPGRRRRRRPR